MAAAPVFAATPVAARAVLSAANTGRDGTGTVVTVLTAGGSGTRVEEIVVIASATTTAGVVRLFVYDGATYSLWKELLVTAITPSTTLAVFTATVRNDSRPDLPLLTLPSGWSLRASTHNAETFQVIVTAAGSF